MGRQQPTKCPTTPLAVLLLFTEGQARDAILTEGTEGTNFDEAVCLVCILPSI